MSHDTDTDYGPYLRQVDTWPSTAREEDLSVASMAPAHAINAYHRLVLWAVPAWDEMQARRTPLAMALLRQAVGTGVLYEADQPGVPWPGSGAGLTLAHCYDMLGAVEDAYPLPDGHPVDRAQLLLAMIREATNA